MPLAGGDQVEQVAVFACAGVGSFAGRALAGLGPGQPNVHAASRRVVDVADEPVATVPTTAGEVMSAYRLGITGEPELFRAFCEEFAREVNRLRMERDADIINRRKELDRIERELDRTIRANLDGVPGAKLKDKIGGLDARKIKLLNLVSENKEPVPLLHPKMAIIYSQSITALCISLGQEDGKVEAVEVLRTRVDQISLVPEAGRLSIVLRGDLAAILTFAANKKRPDFLSEAGLLGDLISRVSVVAGTGFEPVTFRL